MFFWEWGVGAPQFQRNKSFKKKFTMPLLVIQYLCPLQHSLHVRDIFQTPQMHDINLSKMMAVNFVQKHLSTIIAQT